MINWGGQIPEGIVTTISSQKRLLQNIVDNVAQAADTEQEIST